jgi:hypothetical protein
VTAPTRKWWAATVTAIGTVAIAALTGDGINTDPEIVMVVGLGVQRVIAYLVPNEDSPLAAALATPKKARRARGPGR